MATLLLFVKKYRWPIGFMGIKGPNLAFIEPTHCFFCAYFPRVFVSGLNGLTFVSFMIFLELNIDVLPASLLGSLPAMVFGGGYLPIIEGVKRRRIRLVTCRSKFAGVRRAPKCVGQSSLTPTAPSQNI